MLAVLRNQRGISILELMFSFAIIAILVVMVVRYYTVTTKSQKLDMVITQANAVNAAIESWHTSNGTLEGLTIKSLCERALLDDDECIYSSENRLPNPWQLNTSLIITTINNEKVAYLTIATPARKTANILSSKLGKQAITHKKNVNYYIIGAP